MNVTVAEEAISPENLIAGVQLTPPNGIVRVRGRVTDIRPFPKGQCVYGNLTSLNSSATVTFRCPEDAAPSTNGQLAIIEGGVSIKNGYKAGFDLEINGSCLGTFTLPKTQNILMPENRRANISVRELLAEKTNYMFLGTKVGINDAVQAGGMPTIKEIASTTHPDTIIESIKSAIKQDNINAVFLIRGGNDPSLKIWDEPEFIRDLLDLNIPFYTALGHSHFISLADQWADQCFRTPDHAGQEISQAQKNIDSEKKRQLKMNSIDKANDSLKEQLVEKEHLYQSTLTQLTNSSQNNIDKLTLQSNEKISQIKKTNNNLKIALLVTIAVTGWLAFKQYF